MKKLIFLLFVSISTFFNTNAGTLRGAWEMLQEPTSNEHAVLLASQKYLSITVFEKNLYIRCYGGPYEIKGEGTDAILELKLEFNDKNPESVGNLVIFKFNRKENEFTIEDKLKTHWKRIDDSKGALAAVWRITAREGQDGQLQEMKQGSRKTIKICTGTRFQWLAINPETKELSGTGGGTYTLIDGKYIETIEFFSRDNSRVGASLSFDAKIEENKWSHIGKSSKGDRVNEVWTRIE